jgi:hypothetical protein
MTGQLALFIPAPASLVEAGRWVICPARPTGSMDAEVVAADAWLDAARSMQARERREVCLYMIEENGAWTLRHRLKLDGVVS